MLLEFAVLLVVSGLLLLVLGIFIARQYSLRAKLLTAFLVIVLSSLGILAYLDRYTMGESLTQSANKSLSSAARNYAERIDRFNRQNSRHLQAEARLPVIYRFLTRNARAPYNRQALLEILRVMESRQKEYITSYAILNTRGINLIDTVTENIGDDESVQDYFAALTADGQFISFRSPVIFEDGKTVVVFSSAIKDLSGKLVGVLRAKYSADVYSLLFESSKGVLGGGSFATLLDENGLRLVHGRRPDLKYTFAVGHDELTLQRLVQQKRAPQSASAAFVENEQWQKKIYSSGIHTTVIENSFYGLGTAVFSSAIVDLETMPWKIMVSLPQDVFLEPVISQSKNAALLVFVIVLLVILIVLATTQLLLGPVKRLTTVVKKIAAGDLTVKATVEADDEIGGLASAFNEMTQNINTLIVDLEKEVGSHKLTAEKLNKLSQAIEQSPISVMITDLEGKIEYVNPQLCNITGYKEEELIGQNPRIFKSSHTHEVQYKNMWNAITSGQSWNGELYNKKKNGDFFWENVTISPIKNNENVNTHYLAIKEDISLRKGYEERFLQQSTTDKLTGLPNRTLAFDRIQQAIANADREKKQIALLYMDFDYFKNINDTLGHAAGDEFLKKMSGRLRSCVRDIDTVARLGGDEFLIMLLDIDAGNSNENNQGIAFEERVKHKIKEIQKRIAHPCIIHEMEFSITASIGVAFFPQDGDDPFVLLKNADTAMYRSKRKGRNTYQLFTPEMGNSLMERVKIDNKLRPALEKGEFFVKYQALMDAKTQAIVGAEALIRWHDDELGDVSPEEFVPLAEKSGLIVEIGEQVFEAAFASVNSWRSHAGFEDFYIAINLSYRQFRSKDIVKTIADKLEYYNLPGSSIELEITERLLMKDVPYVVAILEEFKAMGIRLSIDDFGTGYSSLSYLNRFPFDVLKIDKAFISGIGEDDDNTALCVAIIAMAHSLGLSVIGEGVETEGQFDFLQERGVEIIQGYFVSEPMTNEDFAAKFLTVLH